MINAIDLRKGLIIKIDGELFSVSGFQHVTPGKGRAHMQVSIKSLKQGNVTQKRFRPSDKVDNVFLDHRDMEYLYQEGDSFCFMDTENYEQVFLSKEVLGDAMSYIAPNSKVTVSLYEGNAIGVELPASVTLKIVETDPGKKGDTVTNVFKPAKLETGFVAKVPLFINTGELIKVDTRTGQFMSRA
ncbi:MAG: translation elongation factor P [Candidatus Scalindua rubra]|uniref:Elongation factor P n=1 Tax=Candidatus Scalindua rubra TaxID=1872076 RepID=A0A1E3X656_9BACT|nr:MAG: translation elongation factor P [Candidatus Scalindua rubra]